MDFSGRKLAKVMQYADELKAKYVVVIGDEELKSEQVELKEMASRTTTKVPLKNLREIL